MGVDDGKEKRQDKNRAINFELTEKMVTDVPDEDPSSEVSEVMKEVSQEGSVDVQKEVSDMFPKGSAPCEARTHDLQIMRLTRCRLR